MKPNAVHPGSSNRLDGVAIFLSGTCMLHCLALPLLVTLFPIAHSSLLQEQTFHIIMLGLILPTSLFALSIGCRKHKDLLTLLLGASGLCLLSFIALLGHEVFGIPDERYVTILGGLILAAAHIQNYRCCRADHCVH